MAQPVPREISNKLSKEEVRYRNLEACRTCGFYEQSGKCEIVDGNISPDTTCDKYQLREKSPEAKHADFYMSEYEKRKK